MQKLLFVIYGMAMGGAEKSLISLLSLLDYDRYSVDLLVLVPQGELMAQIPPQVHLLETPVDVLCYAPHTRALAKARGVRARYWLTKLHYRLMAKLHPRAGLFVDEQKWKLLGRGLHPLPGAYDTAISFFESTPNYYVIEKVTAKRKVLWIHNEFDKMELNVDFQRPYFEQADAICTISELCAANLRRRFPDLQDKFHVVENITCGATVRALAKETPDDARFAADTGYKIVTLSRLTYNKGMDLAVEAAALMKARGLRFHWYVLGDGELRAQLTERIAALGLGDTFSLLGVRINPYAYLARADLVVQPSRMEGRSIAMDEAKLLHRPILATRYGTVADVIDHDVNGYVVDVSAEGIAEGAALLMGDAARCARYTEALRRTAHANEEEIHKYEAIFDGTPMPD